MNHVNDSSTTVSRSWLVGVAAFRHDMMMMPFNRQSTMTTASVGTSIRTNSIRIDPQFSDDDENENNENDENNENEDDDDNGAASGRETALELESIPVPASSAAGDDEAVRDSSGGGNATAAGAGTSRGEPGAPDDAGTSGVTCRICCIVFRLW